MGKWLKTQIINTSKLVLRWTKQSKSLTFRLNRNFCSQPKSCIVPIFPHVLRQYWPCYTSNRSGEIAMTWARKNSPCKNEIRCKLFGGNAEELAASHFGKVLPVFPWPMYGFVKHQTGAIPAMPGSPRDEAVSMIGSRTIESFIRIINPGQLEQLFRESFCLSLPADRAKR